MRVDIEDPNNIVLLNFTSAMRQFNGNRKKSRILASINENTINHFDQCQILMIMIIKI